LSEVRLLNFLQIYVYSLYTIYILYIYMYIHIYTYIYIYMCVCVHTHTRARACVRVYVYAYACVCCMLSCNVQRLCVIYAQRPWCSFTPFVLKRPHWYLLVPFIKSRLMTYLFLLKKNSNMSTAAIAHSCWPAWAEASFHQELFLRCRGCWFHQETTQDSQYMSLRPGQKQDEARRKSNPTSGIKYIKWTSARRKACRKHS
jgi:hypothetical protein